MFKRKNKLVFFVKLGVSLGLLVYLAWLIEWECSIRTLKAADKFQLFIVPFVTLTGIWVASLRWQLTLSYNNVKFSIWQAYRAYLLGLFYGSFLPGLLGGEVVRIGLCIQQTKCRMRTAIASVLVERISAGMALFGMAFLVCLFFPTTVSSLLTIEGTDLIVFLSVGGILGMGIVLTGRSVWKRWLPKESAQGVWSFVRVAMLSLGNLKGRTLGSVLVLSVICQSADIVAAFLLSQAMNLGLSPKVFFVIIPLVCLATILPISLGGLGVREGTLVFLLSRFGVLTSDAVTISLLIYLNRLLIGGMGGGLQLIETLTGDLVRTV